MENRTFFETGKSPISLLGFGCMRFPRIDEAKQDIDEEEAMKMIDYAYQNGVNYFDTAYIYHDGQSELFIKKALSRYPRESFYLADKMPTWLIKNKEDGPRIFEEQLEKCGVDYFDFYLCHSVGGSLEQFIEVYEEYGLLDYLREQKRNGRIKKLGFSFHGPNENMKAIVDRHDDWDFAQIQLNYLDWRIQNAKWKYEYLTEKKIPCIIMEPVKGGNLVSLNEASIKKLKEARPDSSVASWAIRFAASLPNVLTVLSGMTTMEQVVDNIETLSNFEALSEEENIILDETADLYLSSGAIACTGCRYCMDCPVGLDIPELFAFYNDCVTKTENPHQNDENPFDDKMGKHFVTSIQELPEKMRPSSCISCGACVPLCPQSLPIPENMEKLSKIAKYWKEKV